MSRLHIEQFLNYFMFSNTDAAMETANIKRAAASEHTKSLKLTMFAGVPNPNLSDTEIERVWKILSVSLLPTTNAENDIQVRKRFDAFFRAR